MDDFSNPVWLALVEGKQTGPLDARALADWVSRGQVTPQTFFWRRGMSQWRRAADLPELAHVFAAAMRGAPKPLEASDLFSDLGLDETQPAVPPIDPREVPDPSSPDSFGPIASHALGPRETLTGTARAVAPRAWRWRLLSSFLGGVGALGVTFVALADRTPFHGLPLATQASSVLIRARAPATPHRAPPGRLDEEQVARVIAQGQHTLQSCIAEALQSDPNLRIPTFHLRATIAGTGAVRGAAIDRQEVDASSLGDCLKRRAGEIVFFIRFTGGDVEVQIPLKVGAEP